jgi:hypothetical protein
MNSKNSLCAFLVLTAHAMELAVPAHGADFALMSEPDPEALLETAPPIRKLAPWVAALAAQQGKWTLLQ